MDKRKAKRMEEIKSLVKDIIDNIGKASYSNVLLLTERLALKETDINKIEIIPFLEELSKQLLLKDYNRAGLRVMIALAEIEENKQDKKMLLDNMFLDVKKYLS